MSAREFDGYNIDRNAYETGELFGRAARNVAVGLIAGLLVNLLANRRRLTRVSWRELMLPAPFLGGGLLALALALMVGAPLTDAAESRQSAQECTSDQQNPIEAIPAGDRRELSEDDLERLGGGTPSDDGSKFFATRGAEGAALIGTSPIGDSSEGRDQFRAGFTQSVLERGGKLQEEDLPGTDTAIYLRPDGGAAIQGQRGCYAVVIFADRAEVAREQAATNPEA